LNSINQGIVELAIWFHEMRGERYFCRAHRPDVKVVYRYDPGKLTQITRDRVKIDLFRDALQREIYRFAQ
jgi:hypothetical protein